MVFLLSVMVGFALAFAGTVRAAIGLVVGALAMWIVAAHAEHWFSNQPEIYAHLVFAYFVLPFVIAPSTGALVGLTLGRPRSLHAQSRVCRLRDCFREMAAPSVLAASAAVGVTRLARRRLA